MGLVINLLFDYKNENELKCRVKNCKSFIHFNEMRILFYILIYFLSVLKCTILCVYTEGFCSFPNCFRLLKCLIRSHLLNREEKS